MSEPSEPPYWTRLILTGVIIFWCAVLSCQNQRQDRAIARLWEQTAWKLPQ